MDTSRSLRPSEITKWFRKRGGCSGHSAHGLACWPLSFLHPVAEASTEEDLQGVAGTIAQLLPQPLGDSAHISQVAGHSQALYPLEKVVVGK